MTEQFTLPVDDAPEAHLFPDGRRAILVRRPPRGWNGEISWEVWDLEWRARVSTVSHVERDWQPAFASAGDLIAAVSDRRGTEGQAITLHLIDARTGRAREVDRLGVPPGESQRCVHPVFSADGKRAVYGSWWNGGARLRAWDVGAATILWDVPVPASHQPHVVPLPGGTWLVCDGEKYRVIDGATGKWTADPAPNVPAGVTFRATRQGHRLLLVSTESGQRLHVWEGGQGRCRSGSAGWVFDPPAGWSVVPSPDGKTVLVGDSPARLVDLETGKLAWGDTWAEGHTAAVVQLRFSADGSRLASAAHDGTVRVWDAANGRQLSWWKASGYSTGVPYWFHGCTGFGIVDQVPMELSADGRHVAFVEAALGARPITIRVTNVATGEAVAARSLPVAKAGGGWPELPGAVAFSPDGGSVVVTYGNGGDESVLTANQTTARWDFVGDRWTVLGQTEGAPVSRTAVGRSRPVRLTYGKGYSTATARVVVELIGAGLGPLTLSADDRLVAGVGRAALDRAQGPRPEIEGLRIWDARTGEVVARVGWRPPDMRQRVAWLPFLARAGPAPDELQWAWPKVMALNPTGRLLATSDLTGVRLWDAAAGRLIKTCPITTRPPIEFADGRVAEALAFTPDGTRLATGLPDGTILFWPVPKPEPNPPRVDEMEGSWADLIGPDAAKGWRAAWRLEDDPAAAVRLIRGKLKPAEPVPAEDVRRWLADVDAADFRRREAATRKLEAAIDRIVPAVTDALKAPGTSPEARDRLKKVLAAAPDDDRPLPAWAAGLSRAVAVLEHSGSSEGEAALRNLASGAPGAWLTREAQAALDRIRLRSARGQK